MNNSTAVTEILRSRAEGRHGRAPNLGGPQLLRRLLPLLLLLALLLPILLAATNPAPAASRSAVPLEVRPLAVTPGGKTGFTSLAADITGVLFTNTLPEARSLTNHILLNGSGVAAGDIDGDGRCDLYFGAINGTNRLYRNLGGWKFEDITEAAGVGCPGGDTTSAVLADVDGDGDLDLLTGSVGHGTRLFLNDGKGHFHETTAEAGLASNSGTMSLALADVDGDGDLDLYVCNYRTSTMRDTFRMKLRVNRVDGKPVITMVNGRPVTDPDLVGRYSLDDNGNILEHGEADVLFLNDGSGHFKPVDWTDGTFTDQEGRRLSTPPYDWSLTAMFRDLNGDDAPDLYVCGDLLSPDRIWINDGHGRFRAIAPLALRKTSWFSMGVDAADLDRDGHDEIFVTDMVSRDHRMRQVQVSDHQFVFSVPGVVDSRPQTPRNTLFFNCGDGEYLEIAYASGLDATEWSWSPVFLDVDLDGYEDVLVTTGFERDVQDADIAGQLEAMRREQKMSDTDALRMRRMFPRLATRSLAFRNKGNLEFEEVGKSWGFDTPGVSQGVALADLDNDGDLDVIVNTMNGPAGLYRNNSSQPRLAVELQGLPPNTRGIGARIAVLNGAVPRQTQEIQSGGRYLSSDEPMRVFAAGDATNTLTVQIAWRNGQTDTVTNVPANSVIRIAQSDAKPPPQAPNPPEAHPTLFSDRSSLLLGHTHRQAAFNDFERQPLLPQRLSQPGPAVAWFDINGDGFDDLIIGAGSDGQMGWFENDRAGGFKSRPSLPAQVGSVGGPASAGNAVSSGTREQAGVLGLPSPSQPGAITLVAGVSNYRDGLPFNPAVQAFDSSGHPLDSGFPGGMSTTGPLAAADIDGDGDLDLFVGGRVIPGRFPEPPSSRLFKNDHGRWVEDKTNNVVLEKIGLVSGATFTDIDGDGWPDLVLACSWGAIKVLMNHGGQLVPEDPALLWPHSAAAGLPLPQATSTNAMSPWTSPPDSPWIARAGKSTRLGQLSGLWNGVAAGDFDGDGRMDFVASNWGNNSKHEAHSQDDYRLYYGDFAAAGGVETIEAYWDHAQNKIVPALHFGRFAAAIPSLRGRFESFHQFAEASVAEILGAAFDQARELKLNWFETTLFLNRPGGFEPHPLPAVAQWTPAFGVCVADFDGDGNEDVFLSQNFFATEPETGRYDAGRGLLLLGNGHGGLRAIPADASGIRVYGEQRGTAAADFDHDGRTDLVVAQNGAATRLFHNETAKPGLRVSLKGPPSNPQAIGASMRLEFADRLGAAREIHAGSGYWSQDSSDQVLSMPTKPKALHVRWPGGGNTVHPVPDGAMQIVVEQTGSTTPQREPGTNPPPTTTHTTRTFTNPVAPNGADPWVIAWQGAYYLCQSRRGTGVWVNRCTRLQDLGQDHWRKVWTPPAGTEYSKEIWAPELHRVNDRWYVYFAADDGDNAHHRMHVLEGTSQDPQDPFIYKARLAATTDRWAIDGTLLQMPRRDTGTSLYFIWSGWEGTENVAQHLYIAPMSNPWTIKGERVRISSPELEWEKHGNPLINEGPEVLWHGDNLFLIYSASGSWGDDYCLGQLTWLGGDVMNPKSWSKKPQPVFSRTTDVFGPGHGSFVKSRDGTEDWLVYHSAKRAGSGWDRRINLQRFSWNEDADGSPNFGIPVAAGIPQPEPSGDSAP